jgi:hypothetical protein
LFVEVDSVCGEGGFSFCLSASIDAGVAIIREGKLVDVEGVPAESVRRTSFFFGMTVGLVRVGVCGVLGLIVELNLSDLVLEAP